MALKYARTIMPTFRVSFASDTVEARATQSARKSQERGLDKLLRWEESLHPAQRLGGTNVSIR